MDGNDAARKDAEDDNVHHRSSGPRSRRAAQRKGSSTPTRHDCCATVVRPGCTRKLSLGRESMAAAMYISVTEFRGRGNVRLRQTERTSWGMTSPERLPTPENMSTYQSKQSMDTGARVSQGSVDALWQQLRLLAIHRTHLRSAKNPDSPGCKVVVLCLNPHPFRDCFPAADCTPCRYLYPYHESSGFSVSRPSCFFQFTHSREWQAFCAGIYVICITGAVLNVLNGNGQNKVCLVLSPPKQGVLSCVKSENSYRAPCFSQRRTRHTFAWPLNS